MAGIIKQDITPQPGTGATVGAPSLIATNAPLEVEETETPRSLLDFMLLHPQDNITEEVEVSKRFTNQGFKFKIRPITPKEYQDYQQRSVKITGKGRNSKAQYSAQVFNELVVLNHTIEPNFKDVNLLNKAGVSVPEMFINKFLNSGEIETLTNAIMRLSGINESPEEDVEEVKNF